jgi:hypothetical protein
LESVCVDLGAELRYVFAVPARKSRIVENSVIARKIAGSSNRQIASDLKIDRSTVARILESGQFQQAIEFGQVEVHRMIPETCDGLRRAIRKDNVPAILAVLNGTGVLRPASEVKSTTNVQVLVQVQAASEAFVKEIAAFQSTEEQHGNR